VPLAVYAGADATPVQTRQTGPNEIQFDAEPGVTYRCEAQPR
jgi:hypothetical protein